MCRPRRCPCRSPCGQSRRSESRRLQNYGSGICVAGSWGGLGIEQLRRYSFARSRQRLEPSSQRNLEEELEISVSFYPRVAYGFLPDAASFSSPGSRLEYHIPRIVNRTFPGRRLDPDTLESS